MRKELNINDVVYKPIDEFRNKYKYKVIACFKDTIDNSPKYRLFADVCKEENIESEIDAYIIMINPGSCSPKDGKDAVDVSEYTYYKRYAIEANYNIVEARSDMAQKCIMSLMETCRLKKVRILNLSDIREGNLNKALNSIGSDIEKRKEASIFSPERETERKIVMPNDAVCIASWGLDNRLFDLKQQAFNCIGENRIIGVCKDKQKLAYKYIKPRGIDDQKQVILELSQKYVNYKS